MSRVRDFNPPTLDVHATLQLQAEWRPQLFFENRVWQFLIFLPRWLHTKDGREAIFSAHDVDLLQSLLKKETSEATHGVPRYAVSGSAARRLRRIFTGRS